MPCEPIDLPGGGHAILCSRGRRRPKCSVCSSPEAPYLCDGPAPAGVLRKTCDAPLCAKCSTRDAKRDKDLCPKCRDRRRAGGGRCSPSPTGAVSPEEGSP